MDHSFSGWNFQHLHEYNFQAKVVSQLELDPVDSTSCVLLCVNERWVNCGGATIRNPHIADGAADWKVGGTSEIESYGFVARSVQKMFKIILICFT